jgi:hypothetical protein
VIEMNKIFKTGLAVALSAASLATLSAPAQARDWDGGRGGYYGGDRHGDGAGAAIAGGVIGLALGAAIASSGHHDYNGYQSNGYGYGTNYGYAPAYGNGYGAEYDRSGYGYGYGYGGRQCVTRQRVWDGYDGRYEVRRVTVPC